jgi:hypothetical protein
MKVLLVIIGLVILGACVDNEEVKQQEQVKTEIVKEVEDEINLQEQQNEYELKEMQELFENCEYELISVEQTVVHGKVNKYFGGYVNLKGEDNTDQNHYIITVQYDGTRNDWANSWIGNKDNKYSAHVCTNRGNNGRCYDGYMTEREDWIYLYDDYGSSVGDYAEMFQSLFGLHALKDVSGIYMKPSMEIIVIDTNGETIYSVFNGDFKAKVSDWATDEQIEHIYRSGQVDVPFNRDWKEFVLGR